MVLQNNTVLITGGSSGIGLELAKRLAGKKNKVLICGRSGHKLERARQLIPEIATFQCDLSQQSGCKNLALWIKQEHPACNILINNAAIVHRTDFYQDKAILDKAEAEIRTNLSAPIQLTKLFLPLLERNPIAKIINITTGLIYVRKAAYPIYNATKAALHSFTQVLRMQMKNSPTAIIEVLFPAVDTPWHQGNAPSFAISVGKAVQEMIEKVEQGQTEIKVGKVQLLYILSRIAPTLASKLINQKEH